MFATQYYCLVASLKEYALDADTKGFDAKGIVEEILGPEWLNTDMFRIGASSAANNLLSAIEGREIKYY